MAKGLRLESTRTIGLVVIPVGQQCDHLRPFESTQPPVVLVDRGFPLLRLPSVMSYSRQGGFAAVTHLISHGHRRIACIRGQNNRLRHVFMMLP